MNRTRVLQLQYIISFEKAATNQCKSAATCVMYPSGNLVQWLKPPAWKVGDRGFKLHSIIQITKKQTFLPRSLLKIVGSLHDREVGCVVVVRRQRGKFESCVWRAVSSHSSHPPQEVCLAHINLYVHKYG